jgi:carbon storage regulator
MLVLSRKPQEQILIGENILITVVEIRGDAVRLGVDALENVPVHRKEVHTAIKRGKTHKQRRGKSGWTGGY